MRLFRSDNVTRLKLLLFIFNVFGVSTISVIRKRDGSSGGGNMDIEARFIASRWALGYYVLFIWLIVVTNYMTVNALYGAFRASLTMFHVFCFFEMIFGSLVSLLILGYYCLRQKTSIRISSRLCKISSAVKRLRLEANLGILRAGPSCVNLTVGLYLMMTLGLLGLACANYNDLVTMLSSALREFVIIWLLVQYGLVVKLVLTAYETLNQVLRDFDVDNGMLLSHGKSVARPSARQLQLLSSVHELHSGLLQFCQELIQFYELTIFGCIAYVVCCLVVFAYVLIAILVERRSPFPLTFCERAYFVLGLVCYVSAFVLLARYITRTIQEIDKTGIVVQQLIRGTWNHQILKELEDFSLYLLHTKIKFTAWGFFEIDGSLVQSIFSSITTYLVIVIQFQLGSSSKSQIPNNITSS